MCVPVVEHWFERYRIYHVHSAQVGAAGARVAGSNHFDASRLTSFQLADHRYFTYMFQLPTHAPRGETRQHSRSNRLNT